MKILIDADACPKQVLSICLKIGRNYDVPVWTVASFNHNIESDYHIVVGDASQETDIKVLNLSEPGDLVVTQDWGLAAMLLGRGVFCLSQNGKEYRSENIEFLLEARETMARHRRSGGRTKGPKKRSSEDDKKFEKSLDRIIKLKLA